MSVLCSVRVWCASAGAACVGLWLVSGHHCSYVQCTQVNARIQFLHTVLIRFVRKELRNNCYFLHIRVQYVTLVAGYLITTHFERGCPRPPVADEGWGLEDFTVLDYIKLPFLYDVTTF